MKNGVQLVKYSPDKPKKILLIQTKMCYEKIYDSAFRRYGHSTRIRTKH